MNLGQRITELGLLTLTLAGVVTLGAGVVHTLAGGQYRAPSGLKIEGVVANKHSSVRRGFDVITPNGTYKVSVESAITGSRNPAGRREDLAYLSSVLHDGDIIAVYPAAETRNWPLGPAKQYIATTRGVEIIAKY